MRTRSLLFVSLVAVLLGASLLSMRARAAGNPQVVVHIYLDVNDDRVMSDGEGVNGLPVTLRLGDRAPQTAVTQDGVAVFPLGSLSAQDAEVQVDVPYLAMSQRVKAAREGDTLIEFRLPAPEIPVYLP